MNGQDGDPFKVDDADAQRQASIGWPFSWRRLEPRERWAWFQELWMEVCLLRERYRLMIRFGWWEDEIQVEALAALAQWTAHYDSGEWDDPPGKLALLYDLQRIAELLRPGLQPFVPDRDRPEFERYLIALGCEPAADPPYDRPDESR
jgi:hypothetical protein